MELYFQETELQILLELLSSLDNKLVIDVGAEKGGFTEALLAKGAKAVYAFEPFPANVAALRDKFGADSRVKLFDCALGDKDEEVTLNIATDKEGKSLDCYHSLVSFAATSTAAWSAHLPVRCRRLDSLLANGSVPANVGILKIDTEGHDFAVLQGAAGLHSDVVLVELWDHIPHVLGPCPYKLFELVELLKPRGFHTFAYIKHHEEFLTVQVNDPRTRSGDWGNVVFLHDRVTSLLSPILHRAAAEAETHLIDKSLGFRSECWKRLAIIDELQSHTTGRLNVIEDLQRALKSRENSITVLSEALHTRVAAAVAKLDQDRRAHADITDQLNLSLKQHLPKIVSLLTHESQERTIATDRLRALSSETRQQAGELRSLFESQQIPARLRSLHELSETIDLRQQQMLLEFQYVLDQTHQHLASFQAALDGERPIPALDHGWERITKLQRETLRELAMLTSLSHQIVECLQIQHLLGFNRLHQQVRNTTSRIRGFLRPRTRLKNAGRAISDVWLNTVNWINSQTVDRARRTKDAAREFVRRNMVPRIGILAPHPPRAMYVPRSYRKKLHLKNAPRISIVTPSYNQAQFIEATMRSVFDQQYPNLEYVVQDGGSKDHTMDIVAKYRPLLHHAESARDDGQSHALNLGFAHTTGEIMAYLNSDDLLLPGTLHYVAKFFQRHPNIDAVYGHRVIIDENGDEIGRWVLPPHDDDVLSWADYVPQETLFWRRSIWDRVGGRIDESFQFAMDWDLLIRFRDAGARFARLPRFCGAFRLHGAQKTSCMISDLGNREMARLRERCHGRQVHYDEIHTKIRPYLRRHLVYQKLFRLGMPGF
jgi:FkbM family methyltransferase